MSRLTGLAGLAALLAVACSDGGGGPDRGDGGDGGDGRCPQPAPVCGNGRDDTYVPYCDSTGQWRCEYRDPGPDLIVGLDGPDADADARADGDGPPGDMTASDAPAADGPGCTGSSLCVSMCNGEDNLERNATCESGRWVCPDGLMLFSDCPKGSCLGTPPMCPGNEPPVCSDGKFVCP